MPFTILDIIVLLVILISAVLAMVRGFVREVLSIASWVIAAGAAYLLYKSVIPFLAPYFDSQTVQIIVAAAAIFFVALIIASYITMKISDFVIDSRVGAIDRGLGFIFGAARGLLLVVIALSFFTWLVQKPPAWVVNARSTPVLEGLGERLMASLPEDIEAKLSEWSQRRKAGSGDSTPAPDAEDDATPADAPPDQGDAAGGGIDRLIENSNPGPVPGD